MSVILLHYKWLIPLSIFLAHQLIQHALHINISFMDDYLDPFCLGALGLCGIQMERKWLFGLAVLSWVDILVTTIFLVLVSEVLFPYLSSKFIQDWRDAVSICLGVGWFVVTGQTNTYFHTIIHPSSNDSETSNECLNE